MVHIVFHIPYEDSSLYRSFARALQYLTFTRPDISYAIQQTCLFMHNPMEAHMHVLRRILRYIHGTSNYVLHLYPSFITSLISYTDVDMGGCPNTRRSTSGYYVFLRDNILSWSSKRNPHYHILVLNTVELPMWSLNHSSYRTFYLR